LDRGIRERVFFVKTPDGMYKTTPKPTPGHFDEILRSFKTKMIKRLPVATRTNISDFPDYYTGRRKTIYQMAVESLMQLGVRRRDARLKAFVKAEKINFSVKKDPVPRIIQPRDPRYNAELGCFIKPIEKCVYKTIGWIFGSVTVMKGLNAEETGRAMRKKWDRFKKPVAIGLDASRFDQHVSADALRWEHSIYINMFRNKRDKAVLKQLLSWQINNRGFGYTTTGCLSYTVTGCRMSGDMNTGLGNCLLMCAMIHAYCESMDITQYELCNNGDDCTVILENEDVKKFNVGLDTFFLKMGFSMKVEKPVYTFEEIEFCQTHPVYDGQKWVMVRNLTTGLAKDCVSLVYNDTINTLFAYYQVLGDAGLHLTGGIPIWQNFYRRLMQCASGVKFKSKQLHLQHECGMMKLAERMERKFSPPTQAARFSFYLAFGVTPDEQLIWEKYYDKVPIVFRDLQETLSTEFIESFPLPKI